MANYHYPNLTIVNTTYLHINDSNVFDNAVMPKLLLSTTDAISHQSIKIAIDQQFQLDMQLEDIWMFAMDYFIKVNSSDASARMLHNSEQPSPSSTLHNDANAMDL